MARRDAPLPTWEELLAWFDELGIHNVGVAPASVLERARREIYRRAELGYDAGMGFTYRNPLRSTDPQRAVEGARSIIVASLGYGAVDFPSAPSRTSARVARYAWEDVYAPLRRALRTIALRLRAAGERAVAFADDNSIVDREVAYLGGLGWFGKNANLLVQGVGSYVVLGSIVTTANYQPSAPVADGCGTCTRCLDGCPTGAIIEPGVVDANRCLAWLVQKPGSFPTEFREALGDRFYGCDDCQEVCPPTVRLAHHGEVDLGELDQRIDESARTRPGAKSPGAYDRRAPQPWVELTDVLAASDDDLLDAYGSWYLADRDPRWWRRNALIALGNSAPPDRAETLDLVDRYASGDDPMLAEHARWARRRLTARAGASHATATPVTVAIGEKGAIGEKVAIGEKGATAVAHTHHHDESDRSP